MEMTSLHLSHAKPDSLSPPSFQAKSTFVARSTVSLVGCNCLPRALICSGRQLRSSGARNACGSVLSLLQSISASSQRITPAERIHTLALFGQVFCPKYSVLHAKSIIKYSAFKGLLNSSAIFSSNTETTTENFESTTDLLDSVIVFDLKGKGIPISDLWKDRKAVVAFARHFGCVLCRKRADYLAAKKDQMDAAGVALVLIGPGSVDQATAFSKQTKFEGEVYADPSYSSYQALKFVAGVSTTFTPGAALKIIQLYMEGYRQDWGLSFEKDTRTRGGWQQGGIIVAGPGKNNISYIHKDKEAGDDPDIEDILKACCLQVN